MTTRADEKYYSLQNHIDDAVKDVSEIVIDKVWGHEEYNSAKLREILINLLELRDVLKNE
jgi:hypothetical protein